MSKPNIVMSIIRATNILNSIAHGNHKLGQIAASVNLAKPTTHRLVTSLAEAGFVVKAPITSEYYLGPSLLQLASNYSNAYSKLINCAINEMEALKNLSGETVLLHVQSGLNRVCIARVESSNYIRYTNEIGFVAPLYAGGAGKIILSQLSEQDLSLLLDNITLVPFTSNTITDKKELIVEIDKIRKQGYSTSLGERVEGASCISAPINGFMTLAGISILGPITRFKLDERPDVIDAILASAANISNKLKAFTEESQ